MSASTFGEGITHENYSNSYGIYNNDICIKLYYKISALLVLLFQLIVKYSAFMIHTGAEDN